MDTYTPNTSTLSFKTVTSLYTTSLAFSLLIVYYMFPHSVIPLLVFTVIISSILAAFTLRYKINEREKSLSLLKNAKNHESYKKSMFYKELTEVEEALNQLQFKELGENRHDDEISFCAHEAHPYLKKQLTYVPFEKTIKEPDTNAIKQEIEDYIPQIIRLTKNDKGSLSSNSGVSTIVSTTVEKKRIDFSRPSYVYNKEPAKPTKTNIIDPIKHVDKSIVDQTKPDKTTTTKPEMTPNKLMADLTAGRSLFDNKISSSSILNPKPDPSTLFTSSKPSLFAPQKLASTELTPINSSTVPTRNIEPLISLSTDMFSSSKLDHFTSTQPHNLLSNKSDFKAMDVIKEEEDSSLNAMKDDDDVKDINEAKESIKSFVIHDLDFSKLSTNKVMYDQLRQLKQSSPSRRSDAISQSIGEFFGKVCCVVDDHFIQQCLKLVQEFSISSENDSDYNFLIYELTLKLFTETRSRYGSSKINIVS